MRGAGGWGLVAGYWGLGAGGWWLVAGYWVLASGSGSNWRLALGTADRDTLIPSLPAPSPQPPAPSTQPPVPQNMNLNPSRASRGLIQKFGLPNVLPLVSITLLRI